MPSFKLVSITSSILIASFTVQAQYTDTVKIISPKIDSGNLKYNWQATRIKNKFPAKSLLIPGLMIAYGFTALENDG
ncbi:MAG TPA: hypothetical protein PK987_09920, partial [Ferruginibacter sp.]|nr:hypothetical protein [Ferruginibacter sp.]